MTREQIQTLKVGDQIRPRGSHRTYQVTEILRIGSSATEGKPFAFIVFHAKDEDGNIVRMSEVEGDDRCRLLRGVSCAK